MTDHAPPTRVVSAKDLRDTKVIQELVGEGPVLVTRRGRIVAMLSTTSQATIAEDLAGEDLGDASLFLPLRDLNRVGPREALVWAMAGRRKVLTAQNRPIAIIGPADGLDKLRDVLHEAFADVEIHEEPPPTLAGTTE